MFSKFCQTGLPQKVTTGLKMSDCNGIFCDWYKFLKFRNLYHKLVSQITRYSSRTSTVQEQVQVQSSKIVKSFCALMLENLCEDLTFYGSGPNRV